MRLRSPLPLHALLVTLAAVIAGPSVARAQAPLGRVEGRVVDSTMSRPLAGATVFVVRRTEPSSFHVATADGDGRFRVDSLGAGLYAVSFTSPLLDSLDVVIAEREVQLEEGGRAEVALGSPSRATFVRMACGALALPAGQGALLGRVTDAATEAGLAGANVVVAWQDLQVDRATLRATNETRTAAVATDSLGGYRMCGLPTDVQLSMQVQHAGASGAVVVTHIGDSTGVLRRDLSFAPDVAVAARAGPAARRDTTTRADSVRLPAQTGTASVEGVVVGTDDKPLANVQVRVMSARAMARTDSLGRFTLGGLPAGTQMLETRRIGYVASQLPVDLRPGRTVEQRVRMTRIVSLDSVRIVAQRARYPEFERHRRSGFGTFLDEQALLKRNLFSTTDLFRMMPGFRVVGSGFDEKVISSRLAGLRGACPALVIVDGMRWPLDLGIIHPSEIAGIEIYRGNAGAPPQWSSPCGTIVIWTKR